MAIDWQKTIYSQWANSPVMLGIISSFFDAINPGPAIDNFFAAVANLDSAVGWGLDVWGRRVGVKRVVPVASTNYFGFNEAGSLSSEPFGQAPFYSGRQVTQNYPLPDSDFRQLIYAKAAANIWDGSVPGLNLVLRLLFLGEGPYVADNQDMTMTVVLGFSPTPVQQSLLLNTDILPRPAGVAISYVEELP